MEDEHEYEYGELVQDSRNRVDAMLGNGRSWAGDVEHTLAGRISVAFDSLDAALGKLVDEYIADAEAQGGPTKGPYYRRKLLAALKTGEYDQGEEG